MFMLHSPYMKINCSLLKRITIVLILSVFSITIKAQSLYGLMAHGGRENNGYIVHYTAGDHVTTDVYDFKKNGNSPQGDLLELPDGRLFGLTSTGGGNGAGTIFSFNPATGVYQ